MTINPTSCQEALDNCHNCREKLCLRERTINLAIGNTDIVYCLVCLGLKENKSPTEMLVKIKKYILARECFYKEWIKYGNLADCPKPRTCFPQTCFKK